MGMKDRENKKAKPNIETTANKNKSFVCFERGCRMLLREKFARAMKRIGVCRNFGAEKGSNAIGLYVFNTK